MIGFIVQRTLTAIPVLFLVSLITFGLIQLVPGDPAVVIAGQDATAAELARVREMLQLDAPWYLRLVSWYGRLLHGDLGQSFTLGRSVSDAILERAPVTFSLAVLALILTLVFGLVAGVFAALRQNSWIDSALMGFALVGVSLPNFWLALLLQIWLAIELGWLPAISSNAAKTPFPDNLKYYVLPVIVLTLPNIAFFARFMRSSMLEVINQDYITVARSKGLNGRAVLYSHALRNALIPMITVIALQIPRILGGAVIIEQIFAWPGLGDLTYKAIGQRDYPVILAITLITGISVMVVNLLTDLVYVLVDPRVSLTSKRAG